jgi:hypothetical protein
MMTKNAFENQLQERIITHFVPNQKEEAQRIVAILLPSSNAGEILWIPHTSSHLSWHWRETS